MIAPLLIVGGVKIPLEVYPATQTYGRATGGATLLRMHTGAGLLQTHWHKRVTRIDGDGWAPPALAAVDFSQDIVIACIAPAAQYESSNVATLPAARRADLADNVYADAIVAGELVRTTVNVVGDVATAAAVAGAAGYQFWYYPILTCAVRGGYQQTLDIARAAYGWSIDAEEV